MRRFLVFLILFLVVVNSLSAKTFSELRSAYRKQLEKFDFEYEPVQSKYPKSKGKLWNLAVYGRKLLSSNGLRSTKNLEWLNAAIVYRVFCGDEESPLWQRMGYGYQAVKLREQSCGPMKFEALMSMKISPKYPELYLLYGQHCSLVLRMIEKKLLLDAHYNFDFKTLVFELDKGSMTEILKRELEMEDVQSWYERLVPIYSTGIFGIMPEKYVTSKFKELFELDTVTEFGGRKEEASSDIRIAVTFGMDRETAKNVGLVYLVLAQRVWFDASPMLRPSIFIAVEAFKELSLGNSDSFSSTLTKSMEEYSKAVKHLRKVNSWVDVVETALTTGEEKLAPYKSIVNGTKKSEISSYLDEVEAELENLKE